MKKQYGILIDDDSWYKLKVHCAKNKLKLVDKAGEIIEDWVNKNI